MLFEYYQAFIGLFIAVALSAIIIALSYFLVYQQPDIEKFSSYECGFEPFDDARAKFDIRFYLVAILFIIFDLEVTFLFPWALNLEKLDLFGFWSMMVFLVILTVGFVYEWIKGALERK